MIVTDTKMHMVKLMNISNI